MTTSPPILVGLDATPMADRVLGTALTLALARGQKIWLCRSIGLLDHVPVEAQGKRPEEFAELLRKQAHDALEQLSRTVPPALLAGIDVRVDTPWQGVVDSAREHGADLVIIGAHAHGRLDRLLGTTAAKVVNNAHCSVMVVRPEAQA